MSDFKVQASLFAREYSIGYQPTFSLRAVKLTSGKYLIESKKGSGPAEVALGDNFLGKGEIRANDNGDLVFGDYTIPVGHNLLYGVTAEPKDEKKTKFAIFTKGATKKFYKQVTLGEIDESSGFPWEVDQYDNLVNAGRSVKVLPQLNTRNLLVRGQVSTDDASVHNLKDAFYATFEYTDAIDNITHSSRGFYVRNPMRGTVGEFKESVNGELVTTARVRHDNNSFSISMRTPEVAYKAHMLYEEKRDLEKQIASFKDPVFLKRNMSELNPEVINVLKSELAEKLDSVKEGIENSKQDWIRSQHFFSQSEGRELLLGKEKKHQYESDHMTP